MSNKTNSKEVKAIIRNHILENIYQGEEYPTLVEKVQAYKEQLEVNEKGLSYNNRRLVSFSKVIEYTVMGCYGSFYVEYHSIKEFIDSLDINNKGNKVYSDDEYVELYCSLIARETQFIFNHMDEKQLEKMLIIE